MSRLCNWFIKSDNVYDDPENKFVFPNTKINSISTNENGYSQDLIISYNMYENTPDRTYRDGSYRCNFSRGERCHGYEDGSGDDEMIILFHNI